jgi:hypothetical protein
VQLLVSAVEQAAKYWVLTAAPASVDAAEATQQSCGEYVKIHLTVVVVAALMSCLVEAAYVSAYAKHVEASALVRDERVVRSASAPAAKSR